MATAKTTGVQQRQPSRWLRNLALAVLALALAAGAWFWTRMQATALANAAHAAQTGCLCRYAAGRDLDSCSADPGIARPWTTLSDDEAARSVTASVPTLASQTSRWSAKSGCTLERWRD